MKVYVVIEDLVPRGVCYTSLKSACEACGVSYAGAVRDGRRKFVVSRRLVWLFEAEVEKVAGRGRKG